MVKYLTYCDPHVVFAAHVTVNVVPTVVGVHAHTVSTQGTKGSCSVAGDNITYTPSANQAGSDTCTVQVRDNEGSTVNFITTWNGIDTTVPTITIANPTTTPAQSKTITATTNEGILTMTAGSTDETCDEKSVFIVYSSTTFIKETDNGKYVCYRSIDILGNTSYKISDKIAGIDITAPTFTFSNNSGPECVAGSLSITSASDAGAGLHTSPYSFNGTTWHTTSGTSITSQQPGTVVRTGRVRDSLTNSSSKSATYTFTNVAPTASNFVGHSSVGNTAKTVNWKMFSFAEEGSCGNTSIVYNSIVTQGTKGSCSVAGDNITYTPSANQAGSDTCTVQVKDNEGSTVNFIATWNGIDTIVPTFSSKTIYTTNWYTSNQTSTFIYTDNIGITSGIPVACTISTEGATSTCSVNPNVCDAAGNCNTIAQISNSIKLDKTAPTTPTLTCTNFTHNVRSNAGGTVCSITNTAGPSPITATAYSINGGLRTGNSSNLSYTFTPVQGTTNFVMRISDYGGGPTSSNTYILKRDTTPPTGGSFTINNNAASTNSTSVTLNTICATDAGVGGVQVAFGNTASPTNRTTCSASMSHTLTAGAGVKTVYIRFKDSLNNTTTDVIDTITLNNSACMIAGGTEVIEGGTTICRFDVAMILTGYTNSPHYYLPTRASGEFGKYIEINRYLASNYGSYSYPTFQEIMDYSDLDYLCPAGWHYAGYRTTINSSCSTYNFDEYPCRFNPGSCTTSSSNWSLSSIINTCTVALGLCPGDCGPDGYATCSVEYKSCYARITQIGCLQ